MTRRNSQGVANSCDQYRTIKGVRWPQWVSCPSDRLLVMYRSAGCRIRYQLQEVYLHPDDKTKAMQVDERYASEQSK